MENIRNENEEYIDNVEKETKIDDLVVKDELDLDDIDFNFDEESLEKDEDIKRDSLEENLDNQDEDDLIDELDKKETDEIEEDFSNLDLKKVNPMEFETKSAVGNNEAASPVRIINTAESGRRIVFKAKVIDQLELEGTVEIGILDDALILTKDGISEVNYSIKKYKNDFTIYNTNLVIEITKSLNLDSTDGYNSQNLTIEYYPSSSNSE